MYIEKIQFNKKINISFDHVKSLINEKGIECSVEIDGDTMRVLRKDGTNRCGDYVCMSVNDNRKGTLVTVCTPTFGGECTNPTCDVITDMLVRIRDKNKAESRIVRSFPDKIVYGIKFPFSILTALLGRIPIIGKLLATPVALFTILLRLFWVAFVVLVPAVCVFVLAGYLKWQHVSYINDEYVCNVHSWYASRSAVEMMVCLTGVYSLFFYFCVWRFRTYLRHRKYGLIE